MCPCVYVHTLMHVCVPVHVCVRTHECVLVCVCVNRRKGRLHLHKRKSNERDAWCPSAQAPAMSRVAARGCDFQVGAELKASQ